MQIDALATELVKMLIPLLIEQGIASLKRRKGSPQALLERAVRDALLVFTEQYPDVVASLFDEYFMRNRAQALFRSYLSGSGWPDADELATAWCGELGPSLRPADREHVLEAAGTFLGYLERELLRYPPFEHLFKGRVLDGLAGVRDALERRAAPLLAVADLKADHLELGDAQAANLPYVTPPVQEAWEAAVRSLADAAHGDGIRGILVVGAANAGKTRLAFEVVHQALPTWHTVLWYPGYGDEHIPPNREVRGCNVVIFIDDLDQYAAPVAQTLLGSEHALTAIAYTPALVLPTLLLRMRAAAARILVVATCRSEGVDDVRASFPRMVSGLAEVCVPTFPPDARDGRAAPIVAAFAAAGARHVAEYDGTLGSMALGLGAKRAQYLAWRGQPAGLVLRAMKLLRVAMTNGHSFSRLRAVCAEVFGEAGLRDQPAAWEDAVQVLIDREFVTEEIHAELQEPELRIRKDSYFDRVITDYPRRDARLDRDLEALRDALRQLGDVKALNNLGVAIGKRRGNAPALEVYEEALELDPRSAPAWQNKANALYFLGRGGEALEASDVWLELGEPDAVGLSNRGVLLAEAGRKEEALDAFDRALRLDPGTVQADVNKGTLLSTMGRNAEALVCFERALPLEPDNATLLCNLGVVYLRMRRFPEARDVLQRALDADPGLHKARADLIAAVGQLGDLDRARRLLADLSDSGAEAVVAWHNLGVALAIHGDLDGALAAYDSALALDPRYERAWAGKAGVFNQQRRHPEALEACDRALKLDRQCAQALFQRGAAYCGTGQVDRALLPLDIATHLDPENASAWYFKGVAHAKRGQDQEALRALRRAVELDPLNAAVAEARRRVEEHQQAREGET